jgi:hypothetical protein
MPTAAPHCLRRQQTQKQPPRELAQANVPLATLFAGYGNSRNLAELVVSNGVNDQTW